MINSYESDMIIYLVTLHRIMTYNITLFSQRDELHEDASGKSLCLNYIYRMLCMFSSPLCIVQTTCPDNIAGHFVLYLVMQELDECDVACLSSRGWDNILTLLI